MLIHTIPELLYLSSEEFGHNPIIIYNASKYHFVTYIKISSLSFYATWKYWQLNEDFENVWHADKVKETSAPQKWKPSRFQLSNCQSG